MATTSLYPRRGVVVLLGGCAGFLDAVGHLTFGIFFEAALVPTAVIATLAGWDLRQASPSG